VHIAELYRKVIFNGRILKIHLSGLNSLLTAPFVVQNNTKKFKAEIQQASSLYNNWQCVVLYCFTSQKSKITLSNECSQACMMRIIITREIEIAIEMYYTSKSYCFLRQVIGQILFAFTLCVIFLSPSTQTYIDRTFTMKKYLIFIIISISRPEIYRFIYNASFIGSRNYFAFQ